MSAHTPGPWTWGEGYQGLYGSGERNEVMTFADYENMWVAETPHKDANARLIAAAPDLFELVETANHGSKGSHTTMWQERARAVIAKARGAA